MHPPFRAEHIGSLLRPAALLALRKRFEAGDIDASEFAAAENRAIEDAVRLRNVSGFDW
jgi:5-methyltetrahydropteroyltriglutamate--homocysteine methyltransferase